MRAHLPVLVAKLAALSVPKDSASPLAGQPIDLAITTNGATLNTLTNVTFTLTNSLISVKDVIILNVSSNATSGAYNCWISSMSAGTCTITLRNISGGNLSEAVVINFAIIHGAS